MADELRWEEAIMKVLGAAESAMHYSDIADLIVQTGLRVNVGATPASTVNSVITTNMKTRGASSDFVRTGRGEYILRSKQLVGTAVPTHSPTRAISDDTIEVEPSAIEALGMYWRRDLVVWTSNPQLLGQQQRGATTVDFSDQRGVYLLHDGRATVYVGRVTDRPLGRRLQEHTIDRLNGRWDRFSWFGVRAVREDGTLHEKIDLAVGAEQIIVELEAVLIESLEPPLNRRRGDGLRAVEYVQVEDPALQKKQLATLMAELQARMFTVPSST